MVLDICTDRGTERCQHLCGRVPSNDVAADDIAGHLSASTQIDAVDVSADPIILNQVVLACVYESQAEIVATRGGGRGLGGRCTIAIERVQPNSVVAAPRQSSAAARCSVRTTGIVSEHVFLDDAIRGADGLKAAPAVVVSRNPPHSNLGTRMARQPDEDSPALKVLDDSRTLDLYIISVNRLDADAIHGVRRETATGWRCHRSRYRVSVQVQLDVISCESYTRICPGKGHRDRAGNIAHQLGVFEKVDGAGNGWSSADFLGVHASGTNKERCNR
jgi:hypothetical protein